MGFALRAIPFSNGQGQTLGHESTDVAAFAGRKETVNDLQFLSVPRAFVFYHAPERGQADIADGPRQTVIRYHAPDVQVFNGEYIEAANKGSRPFIKIVFATVGDMCMQSGYLDALTIPSPTSFVSTGKNPLQPLQLGRIVAEMFRICDSLPGGQCCQPVYSEVYTHNFAGLGDGIHLFVEAKRHEVTTGTVLGYRNRAGDACERPRPVNVHPANARDVQVPIHGVPLECTPSVFSGLTTVLSLEGRIRTSLLEEILERGLKMPKRLLLWNTGGLLQPRKVFGIAVLCPRRTTGIVVDGLSTFEGIGAETECPVVGMADATEDTGKFTLLRRCRIHAKSISHLHKNRLLYVRLVSQQQKERRRRFLCRGLNPAVSSPKTI